MKFTDYLIRYQNTRLRLTYRIVDRVTIFYTQALQENKIQRWDLSRGNF